MNSRPTKKQVLEMIQRREVAIEEGLVLLKSLRQGSEPAGGDLLYARPEWEGAELPAALAGAPGDVLVFDTDDSLARALREQQPQGRIVCVLPAGHFQEVDPEGYTVNPADPEQYRALVGALTEKGFRVSHIVWRWSRAAAEAPPDQRIEQTLTFGIRSLFRLTRAMLEARVSGPVRLLYLFHTADGAEQALSAQATTALHAAVGGFARTLRLENPRLLYRTVEVPANLAEADLPGLLRKEWQNAEAADTEVRYRAARRFVRRLKRFEPQETANPLTLRKGGVYLITGGLGGLGLIFAEHLARSAGATLVLTGRSAPSEAQAERLETLKRLGAQVLFVQADVARRSDVQRLFETIRERYSTLHGMIHSAGVTRDAFVLKKTEDEWNEVLAAKVFGTAHLAEMAPDGLDFLAIFSSTTAVLGNAGQGDYAYANAFCDALAERRESLRPRLLSVNWPLWQEGGMQISPQTAEHLHETLGMVPLETETGVRAFDAALRLPWPQVVILAGDGARLEQMFLAPPVERVGAETGGVLARKTVSYLIHLLSDELKLPPERIDPLQPLERYGIDSIVIMKMTAKLEQHFGPLSKTLFFEYQTLDDLTGYFVTHHQERLEAQFQAGAKAQPAAVRPAPPRPAAAQLPKPRFLPAVTTPAQAVPVQEDAVAVIGMSGRFPMAGDLDEFWANLKEGRDCITTVPADRWNHQAYFNPDRNALGTAYSKWGGFLDGVELFDPLFFNLSPREAEIIDPQERLFLQTVWHTIEDAGYTRHTLSEWEVGVFVGVMYGHYQLYGAEQSLLGNRMALSSSYASVANRVSYALGFRGPSMAVDTMCSSSLTSLHLACESIRRGESDLAVAGGVNVTIHPNKYQLLSLGKFLSTDGRCRAFGEGGDGYVPGEGVGAVLLKPLRKAIADGDHIYGVIRATAVNHGGKTNGYSVPNPHAQAAVISRSLRKAGIDPDTISYVEAHGTGTALGDPIEITALSKAFGEGSADRQPCAIGSVKSNIGHLESAAGIAGLIKVLLCLRHRQLVPSLHSERLNPHIAFAETPFHVPQSVSEWKRPELRRPTAEAVVPRRAGISSFGAGGSNAHVVVEEYVTDVVLEPVQRHAAGDSGEHVLVLSARNEERLQALARHMAAFLARLDPEADSPTLEEIAYTLQVGREAMEERLAIVASRLEEALSALQGFCSGGLGGERVFRGRARSGPGPTTMLVDGPEGREFLQAVLRNGKWDKAAQLWVNGAAIDWTLLYGTHRPRRVPLPTYRFAQQRYWAPDEGVKPATGVAGSLPGQALHPLIDTNESTFAEQCYRKRLTGGEFYLTDHVMGGEHVLPGVVLLEMARAAGSLADGQSQVGRIRNVVWAAPVAVSGAPVDLRVSLFAEAGEIEYEITTGEPQAGSKVHSRGVLGGAASPAFPDGRRIDLAAVERRLPHRLEGSECYRRFAEQGFSYGPALRSIKRWSGSDTEALALLEVPALHGLQAGGYLLHPALLDGALQTVIGLMSYSPRPGRFLPFALGEVAWTGPLPASCWAHVVLSEGRNSEPHDGFTFDIRLISEDGQTLAFIQHFVVRAVQDRAQAEPSLGDDELRSLLHRLECGEIKANDVKALLGGTNR
jgi:acyl transferase domain-containing protein/NAD(P)-dependent dehydrogenase (short-subunit alcohol dehydrogenase family)/acyl carrier protein